MDWKALGSQVRKYWLAKKLTQEDLAEQLDISTSFLGHIERGTRKMSLETFVSFCTVLEVSPNMLLQPTQKELLFSESGAAEINTGALLQDMLDLINKYRKTNG